METPLLLDPDPPFSFSVLGGSVTWDLPDRWYIRQLSFETGQDVFKGVLKKYQASLVPVLIHFNIYVLQIQRDHVIQRIKTIAIFPSLLTVTMIARTVMMRILITYLILINR